MTVPATSPEPGCPVLVMIGSAQVPCGFPLDGEDLCTLHMEKREAQAAIDAAILAGDHDRYADLVEARDGIPSTRPAAASPVTPGAGDGMNESSVHGAATPGTADGGEDEPTLLERLANAIPTELMREPCVGVGGARALKIAYAVMPVVEAALAARDGEVRRLTADVERMAATARYGRAVHEKLTFWLQAHAPTFPASESEQVADTMLAYAALATDALKRRDAEITQWKASFGESALRDRDTETHRLRDEVRQLRDQLAEHEREVPADEEVMNAAAAIHAHGEWVAAQIAKEAVSLANSATDPAAVQAYRTMAKAANDYVGGPS